MSLSPILKMTSSQREDWGSFADESTIVYISSDEEVATAFPPGSPSLADEEEQPAPVVDEPEPEELPDSVSGGKQSRWWWFIVQVQSVLAAIAWLLPTTPAVSYACWRPHTAPTTGQAHVHCLVWFKNPQRFEQLQKKGYNNVKYLSTHAQKKNCYKYCVEDLHKDGSPKGVAGPLQEIGTRPKFLTEDSTGGGAKRAAQDDIYREAMEQPTPEEALEIIKERAPRDFIIYHQQVTHALAQMHAPKSTKWQPRYLEYNWKTPDALEDWLNMEMPKESRRRCLIVVSPTRYGKTEWARHLYPDAHMYFRHMFNLDLWNPLAKLIIFDDVDWDYIPAKKVLLTDMGEGTVTDKYRKKQQVHVNMPAIVLCNEVPDFKNESAYWQENSVIVHLDYPLYDD